MTFSAFDRVVDRRGTNSIKWSRYGKEVLPLWVADMDFPAPEPVRQALRAAIDHGVFGYEWPSRKLTETVASRMERLYQWKVGPEMVLAIPGIVAGFKTAASAVGEPGEGVLIQPPVYPPFLKTPEDTGTRLQIAQLRQVNSEDTLRYEIDWQTFENAIHSQDVRTRMFLLCQPHNPTGQIYSRVDLERMADICSRNDIVICSDEIHSELLLGGARHVPIAALNPEIAQRTITLISPSKTFNLVGLFCGFAIIPNPALRQAYRRALEHLALHVNSLGLIAAEAAFSGNCEDWLNELRRYLTGNRDYLMDFVSNQWEGVRVTKPEATYLAWLDFGEWVRDGRMVSSPFHFLLEKAKVALNPGAEFGPGGEGFVRLNFGCPRATLEEALDRVNRALSE